MKELIEFMDTRHPEVLKLLREKKDLTDDVRAALDAALEEFKSVFKGVGRQGSLDGFPSRHPHPDQIGAEHAEDHQGDEAGRRCQAAARAGRGVAHAPYAQALSELLGSLARARAAAEVPPHPLMEVRENPRRIEVVLLTSDRGLCGGFNSNIIRRAQRFVVEEEDKYEAIQFLHHRPARPRFREEAGNRDPQGLRRLLRQAPLRDGQAGGRRPDRGVPRAEARCRLPALQPVQVGDDPGHHLHPASPDRCSPAEEKPAPGGSSSRSISTKPSRPALLEHLIPRQLAMQIWRSCWNRRRRSTAPRMTAMDSATKNANEMIGRPLAPVQPRRQASITKELMEIVSGAER